MFSFISFGISYLKTQPYKIYILFVSFLCHPRLKDMSKLYRLRSSLKNKRNIKVRIGDLCLGHAVGWNKWIDPALHKRMTRLDFLNKNKLPLEIPTSATPITVVGNMVVEGNGRVFAMQQTGWKEHYIEVVELF